MGRWVFEELKGAAVKRGPQEALLFKSEQSGEGEYAGNDHLVREVLQNALDARRGDATDEPVRVRFAIHEPHEAPPADRLKHYFDRLKPALKSKEVDFRDGVPKWPCRFLVCEDFGTRGLEGNTILFEDPPPGSTSREDFYWFWRNIGRSAKTGDDLGRWGLGKTVFRAVSRVGSMFGLTIRQSDQQRLLMGQSVLEVHKNSQVQYQPEGYWCGSQEDGNGIPLPIEQAAELDQFAQEWRLTRVAESGTSVVSPFIPDELRAERLLQAVVVHFFTRILRGEMEVIVEGQDLGIKRLTSETIQAIANEITWNGSKRNKLHAAPPIAFAKECLAFPPTVATIPLAQRKIPAKLETTDLAPEALEQLQTDFAAGERVAVRLRMHLPRVESPDLVGELDVYLQRLSDGQKPEAYFVREGMTISKLTATASSRGVQSLVLVERGPLAELLGDAEGPAHEDWNTSEDRPNKKWKAWKGRVTFLRKIVDRLAELLTPATSEKDLNLLSDYFSLEKTGGNLRNSGAGLDKKKKPPLDIPIVPPKWYRVTERKGGFTLSQNPNVPLPSLPELKVLVAYDLPRGNPLKNWSPLDFRFDAKEKKLKLKFSGAELRAPQGNCLLMSNIQADFSMTIEGFDENRDLYVRVEEAADNVEVEND